jgi:ABC-type lipoprotein export system ATPase subunit/GNAT superfamily N-acetyltransferase
MKTTISVATPIVETPRVAQVRGQFDLPRAERSALTWQVDLPLEARPWQLGLVVGPSGCGKSTVANRLWPDALDHTSALANLDRGAVVDAFPDGLGIGEITELLSSVGLASPPCWLRPLHVLSTGQQFRVKLALLLAWAAPGGLVVCDEYSSVVDRTVAQVGSHALARTVRRRGLRFIAVTCHDDVDEWLQPDWVYRPAENAFLWRCLQRRPAIELDVVRCQASAWPLFAPYHYLSHAHARGAVCFVASWRERPVAFSSWLPFVGRGRRAKREHRTVTLPDYQGAGIGNALSAFAAALWKGLGFRALSTTTHPAMIAARRRSALWNMTRPPSFARPGDRLAHATTRLTAGFEYVGPAQAPILAKTLLATR